MFFPAFLTFSDAAKFADIARMILTTGNYAQSFTFWNINNVFPFSAAWTPPVMPFSIFLFFKFFGLSDFSVIATSFFYFILTVAFTYLLANRVFKNKLSGVLSAGVVLFNYDLLRYATDGASESPFIFEIVAASFFLSSKKIIQNILGLLFLVLMYFTRPQAFIYIVGLLLFYLFKRFKIKTSIVLFSFILIAGFLFDRYGLTRISGKYFLYSITGRGASEIYQTMGNTNSSSSLRGATSVTPAMISLAKKAFYNFYNFYKLAPQIINPYLLGLFVISLVRWKKDKVYNSLKIATVFVLFVTLLVTALSIPFFRYLHPVVPLVYIFAVEMLVWTITQVSSNKRFIALAALLIILILGVGQTLGTILLDSRFEKNTHNVNKAPVYVGLSRILKDNTDPSQVIVTNLDTWGSWYGERKTVWFPLEPKQIVDPITNKIPFDVIYLTSYLIDDENYYMGPGWKQIFENPSDSKKWTCDGCSRIAKEFKLKGIYSIDSSEDYEKKTEKAILLLKR